MNIKDKKVIGYKMYFGDDFLKKFDLSKEDLINCKLETGIVKVVSENKCEQIESDDVLFNTLKNNPVKIIDFCEATNIATILYENPVPIFVFNEFKGENVEPIFL